MKRFINTTANDLIRKHGENAELHTYFMDGDTWFFKWFWRLVRRQIVTLNEQLEL